jgi:hypothetical protein
MARKWQRFVALIVLGLAVIQSGPASAQREVSSSSDPYVHREAGVTFPDKLDRFVRGRIYEYDPSGRDVSVAYRPRRSSAPMEMTVYVYPASVSCADEFSGTSAAIEAHPGSRLVDSTDAPAPEAFEGIVQSFARYALPPGAMGYGHPDVLSEAWLACPADGRWLVKLRFTYEAVHAAESEGMVEALLGAIDWRPLLDDQ